MKTSFPTIFHLIFATGQFLNNVVAQKPPQLLPTSWNKQRIVEPETTVTLPCPVYGDKSQMIFDWYKDKELVVALGGYRHRITGSGALRIKDVSMDDTGVYTCRAVNGFGSVEHNITLIVLDDNEDYAEDDEEATHSEESISLDNEEFSTPRVSFTSIPHLLYVTEWNKTQQHLLPGSSIIFHCVATGYPKPKIVWLRTDGQELPRSAKKGRWSLRLQNLRERDSGNYTCTAKNILGTASHSFFVDVSILPESSRLKPVLIGEHPTNVTVEEGQIAIFQCVIKSVLSPHIEWLKRVEEHEMKGDEFSDVIKMDTENFRVIKSSDIMGKDDGSFFNKLVIQEAQVGDTGKYICFGANTNGYSYRSAYLTVYPKPNSVGVAESLPFPIVVTTIVLGLATVTGIIAILIYCRSRQRHRDTSNDNSTDLPMVTKDVFMPVQQRCLSSTSRTCNNVPFESSRNRTPQVSMYVPNCALNGVVRYTQQKFSR